MINVQKLNIIINKFAINLANSIIYSYIEVIFLRENNVDEFKLFALTQKCPFNQFEPKDTRLLDICDNCKWAQPPFDKSELIKCLKIKN